LAKAARCATNDYWEAPTIVLLVVAKSLKTDLHY